MITLLLQYWNREKDPFVNYIISVRVHYLFWYQRDHARLCSGQRFFKWHLQIFVLAFTTVTELIAWNERHCMLDRVQLEYSWYGLQQRDENKILSCLSGTNLTIFRFHIYCRKVFFMIMLHFPLEVVLLDRWLQKQPLNIPS